MVLPFAGEHGGLEQYAVDLVTRARSRGWAATVIVPHDQPDTTWFRRSLGPVRWMAASPEAPATKAAQDRSDRAFWRRDGRQALASADLVHLLGKPKSFVREAAVAARKAGVAAVYTEVAQITEGYARGSDLAPFQRTCNDVPLATTYCEAAAGHLRDRFGYRGPVRVVDQWLAPELEARLLAIDRPRGSGGEVVVGSLSRLGPEKGLDTLVAAYARARTLLDDVPSRLRIGGTGPEASAVRAAIEREGIDDHVELLGYVEDKPALLAAIDVFVVSSHVEGGPISAVEAMAAGCAVASTDVGAMAARLAGCPDGELVAPDDPAALAAAIAHLVRRSADGDAGASLRTRFLEANAGSVLGPRMDAVWDELLAIRPRRGRAMRRRARP